jgi:hypothetical protein
VIAAAQTALARLGEIEPDVEARVLRWLRLEDSIDINAALLGQRLAIEASAATRIAEALTKASVFERREVVICPNPDCGIELDQESLAEHRCQTCSTDLDEDEPRSDVRYLLERPRARDAGWLIALHGIRTRGPWQEQLQWLIDRQFLRTIPFKNWKYGRVLGRSLIPAAQRRLVRRFLDQAKAAQGELRGVLSPGAAQPPDVVAHSFGTWIVAHALQEDPTLRLGDVILVGSIVRPDWPWDEIIERGQVNALLNYCGDRDLWVRLAERFIPDSGPSGAIGFTQRHDSLINVLRPGGDHSSPFSDERLPPTFENVWHPFLSARPEWIDASEHRILDPPRWVRAPLLLRAPATLMLSVVGIAVIVAVIVVLVS